MLVKSMYGAAGGEGSSRGIGGAAGFGTAAVRDRWMAYPVAAKAQSRQSRPAMRVAR
jgi:hypothetical protein